MFLCRQSDFSLKGKPVVSAMFPLVLLSDAAQLLPLWLLNGLGSNVPSCPSSAHQHTPVTQQGLKVNMLPTANTSTGKVSLSPLIF